MGRIFQVLTIELYVPTTNLLAHTVTSCYKCTIVCIYIYTGIRTQDISSLNPIWKACTSLSC